MPESIKSRLLLGLILPIMIAIIGGSFSIYSLFQNSLYAEIDHFLSDKLRFHRFSLFQEGNHISFNMDKGRWKALQDEKNPEYFHFRYHRSDRLIMKSPSLPKEGLPSIGRDSDDPVFENITLPGNIPARAVGISFFPAEVRGDAEPNRLYVVVAEDSSRILAALARLRIILITVSATATFFVIFSAWRIVRRNLRPLDDLSRQIEEIPVSNSKAHFALANAPSELNPVINRMNALMDRVSAAIEKERQFTANAAHELRNPLAGIRAQLELAISRNSSVAEYEKSVTKVLKTEERLEQLVENLLFLTKLEAGQIDTASVSVSIPVILRRAWKPCFETAEQKSLTVNWNVDSSADRDFLTSPHLVHIVLSNIFQNAVIHSQEMDTVGINAKIDDGSLRISACNPSGDLQADDIPRLFERFWRASDARDQSSGNTGIGLSLCQRITATLGGEINASINGQKLLCVTVILPESALTKSD